MIKKKLLSLAMAGTIGLTTLASPTLLAKAAPSTVSEFDSLISDLTSEQNEASNKLAKLQKEIKEKDRKSTRLNSSHVSISYAVFCLKKKKNNYKTANTNKTIN